MKVDITPDGNYVVNIHATETQQWSFPSGDLYFHVDGGKFSKADGTLIVQPISQVSKLEVDLLYH